MKVLLRLLQTSIIVMVMITLHTIYREKSSFLSSFELDAVSAATDGTECTDPAWIGCSVGWLEKGYVFDKSKGYFVKSAGATTTKATTVITTKATNVTTKPITTTKTAVTNKVRTSAAITSASTIVSSTATTAEVTTIAASSTTGPKITEVSKINYTTRSRPQRTTSVSTANKAKNGLGENTFLSDLPIGWIVGIVGAAAIMVVEFVIVRSIYKKD